MSNISRDNISGSDGREVGGKHAINFNNYYANETPTTATHTGEGESTVTNRKVASPSSVAENIHHKDVIDFSSSLSDMSDTDNDLFYHHEDRQVDTDSMIPAVSATESESSRPATSVPLTRVYASRYWVLLLYSLIMFFQVGKGIYIHFTDDEFPMFEVQCGRRCKMYSNSSIFGYLV